MRFTAALIAGFIALPFSVSAQDKAAQDKPAQEKPAPEKPAKQDYKDFSRLVHSIVVKELPKEIEDTSGWGGTIPYEPNLPLPRLRRVVKVGDKLEMPHGTWRKFKGKIEEPDKNLKIVVKDFKSLDSKTYRVVADVDTTFLVRIEVQQWQKGLPLIGADLSADANVTAAIVCDVGVSLNLSKFPPELKLEPKVTELGLDFIDFKVRGGPIIQGEFGDNLRKDLKEGIRAFLKASEPAIKAQANQAIEKSLKEGKGTISADAILKAMPK
jgi:hypothetical protein